MRSVRRRTAVASVLLVGVALFGSAVPAWADGQLPPSSPPASSGGQAVVNRCVLYANASGFGADCAGGSSGVTVKEILHGEKFPECRYDPVPADMTPPDTHAGEPGSWYLETCLKGIKKDGTGDFTRTSELVWFPDGSAVPTLTHWQGLAWQSFRSVYPVPMPAFGPASQPRVLIPTFFWLTDSSSATIARTVWDGTRDVAMRAYVQRTEVYPGRYAVERPLVCAGAGRPYDHSKSIYDQSSTCRYQYDRSSAFRADRTFDVMVQADWVVEYQNADGSWARLGQFPMRNVFATPVNEIQTVVS